MPLIGAPVSLKFVRHKATPPPRLDNCKDVATALPIDSIESSKRNK